MFDRGKRIKKLEAKVEELINENEELEEQVSSKNHKLNRSLIMVYTLRAEKRVLLEKLKTFEPVLNEPKIKPAVSKFCEMCDYRVMAGPNVVGCCKGNACEDFERRGVGNDQ